MFGQLRENILLNLESSKKSPAELKAKFASFTTTLKESKELYTLYQIYEMVETAKFENQAIAKEFLDECLNRCEVVKDKMRGKDGFAPLRPLAEGQTAKLSPITKALDAILFENLNTKEKYDQKAALIKSLTDKTQKPDFKEMITTLDKKVTTQVGKLTTEQKEALEVFMENDQAKQQKYFTTLVESTIEAVEEKILATESVETNRKLIEVKKRLQQLKSQSPNIEAVDSILELKADLNA
jgi:hypothetical protein